MWEWLKKAYKVWKWKRTWTPERQLEHIKMIVQTDDRWMAHDPKVSALTHRYLELLGDDWMSKHVEPVQDFRIRIGADPIYNQRKTS